MNEEAVKETVANTLIPDRWDILKMVIFLIILLFAFFVGYEYRQVYTCKVWYHNQLMEFPNSDEPMLLWHYLNTTKNITSG